MPSYLLDTDHYEPDELGRRLYQALSIGMSDVEPYAFLPDEEKEGYILAGLDFIRYLQRNEGRTRRERRRRLWYFDFMDNKAKKVWMYADPSDKDNRTWRFFKRRGEKFYLGETCFMYEDEALQSGFDTITNYQASFDKVKTRIGEELQEFAKRGGQRDFITLEREDEEDVPNGGDGMSDD